MVLSAGLGYALCRATGWNVHYREMIAAAMAGLLAGEIALIPALLARGSSVATASQAGLAGTVAHMLLSLVFAGIVMFGKLVGDTAAFVNWLLLFTFVSLAAVAGLMVYSVRLAEAMSRGSATKSVAEVGFPSVK